MILTKLKDDVLLHYLNRFDKHCFNIRMKNQTFQVGSGTPEFTIVVNGNISKKDLAVSTSLALAEAYMRHDLEIEGDENALFTCIANLLEQAGSLSLDRHSLKDIFFMSESQKAQKEQVQSHYDLGNDFYRLWLDPTMTYSCAYFQSPDDTLEQAQKNKVDRILKKLYLKPGMTLLDIGCGWGYLLIEAAKKYQIKGVGCTLSEEQWKKGQDRIKKLGLEEQLEIKLMDYRDLAASGQQFDRLVSVGMMEHVGRKNYPVYFEDCNQLLKDGGLFLLHTITGHDEKMEDTFMRKYIFPGGMLPSLREAIHIAYDKEFIVQDVESLRRHYYKTLMCWYQNFKKVHDKVRDWKGDEFVRMWDLYLVGCAAAFYIGFIDIHQILMTKGNTNDLPMTRWY